jgi:hypothetical protein
MDETTAACVAIVTPLLIALLVFAVFPSKLLVRLLAGVSALGFLAMNLSMAMFNYERSGGRSDIFIAYGIYAAIAGAIVWGALRLLLALRNVFAPPFRASRVGLFFLTLLCALWIALALLVIAFTAWLGIAHLEPPTFSALAIVASLVVYGGCAVVAGIGILKIRRNQKAMAHYATTGTA